jgi:hypothetical protein
MIYFHPRGSAKADGKLTMQGVFHELGLASPAMRREPNLRR